MAITSVRDYKFISVTHDAATAWTWQDATHGWGNIDFVQLDYILWIPNATDDVIHIKNGSTSGPTIFYAKAVDVYDQRIVYFYGKKCCPVIDQTPTTGASQVICFAIK